MTPENFVYWLQGYLELSGSNSLDEKQMKVIKEHIALVMNKVTVKTVDTINPVWQQPHFPIDLSKITC